MVSISSLSFSSGVVTLDVLDIVEFMALLFDQQVSLIPRSYLICIMAFTCIAFIVPVVALLDLTNSSYGVGTICK